MSDGRRRRRKKGPPPPARELAPLPPGSEVEVRVDDDEGFFGSWFEATVVAFTPGGSRARYTVAYSHLLTQDGARPLPDPVSTTSRVRPLSGPAAASRVRPRPPPPPPLPPPQQAGRPRFVLHDIVEAFHRRGWRSGIAVPPAPTPAHPVVTVAFPAAREVVSFPPYLVRPRRDYAGGEWVPSGSVIDVRPSPAVRAYRAGEKVEVLRKRDAYGGDSWFPATVAKAVDRFSYIVHYSDGEERGWWGEATEYLHWGCIRPAEYHCPRESKFRLVPGDAVEVRCDGAWSPGMVRRVVGERCEYEVSVGGESSELLLTVAAEAVRPLYMWDGKHLTLPTDKRQSNWMQQSASDQNPPISRVHVASSGTPDPKLSTVKKPRKETQLQEITVDGGYEHALVSETDTSLSKLCKSLASNYSLNPCALLSGKNGLPMLPRKIEVGTCPMPKNRILCASSGHSAPPDDLTPNVIGVLAGKEEAPDELEEQPGNTRWEPQKIVQDSRRKDMKRKSSRG